MMRLLPVPRAAAGRAQQGHDVHQRLKIAELGLLKSTAIGILGFRHGSIIGTGPSLHKAASVNWNGVHPCIESPHTFPPPAEVALANGAPSLASGGAVHLRCPGVLIAASIAWAFNSPGLYQGGFEKYSISLRSGITNQDLRQVAADLRGYFNSREEPLSIRAPIFGEERELFNDREVSHMRDVKRLVWGVYLLAAVLESTCWSAWCWGSPGSGRAIRVHWPAAPLGAGALRWPC